MSKSDSVTASEIGEYVYCHRAWWLRFHGLASADSPVMSEGRQRHTRLFSLATLYAVKQKIIFFLIMALVAMLLLLFTISLAII